MFTPLSSLFIFTVKCPKAILSGSDRLAGSIRDEIYLAQQARSVRVSTAYTPWFSCNGWGPQTPALQGCWLSGFLGHCSVLDEPSSEAVAIHKAEGNQNDSSSKTGF